MVTALLCLYPTQIHPDYDPGHGRYYQFDDDVLLSARTRVWGRG
jgi:hypothetical protein